MAHIHMWGIPPVNVRKSENHRANSKNTYIFQFTLYIAEMTSRKRLNILGFSGILFRHKLMEVRRRECLARSKLTTNFSFRTHPEVFNVLGMSFAVARIDEVSFMNNRRVYTHHWPKYLCSSNSPIHR